MAKVVAVIPVPAEEVFDLEVEDCPVFSLENGAFVHNSQHYLGRNVRTFSDVAGKTARFDLITPEEGLVYAASDSAHCFLFMRSCGRD